MKNVSIIVILLITAILRFYNLMHDAPYFFNPDERNMANAITQFRLPTRPDEIVKCVVSELKLPIFNQIPNSIPHSAGQISNCSLNPHFFAYGQFPLYLAFVSDILIRAPLVILQRVPLNTITTSFPSAIFWLRFYSALSSTLTVFVIYLIAKLIPTHFANRISDFGFRISDFAALCAAFTPALIQSAHFGTTESLLTFFFMISIYISLKLNSSKNTILSKRYVFLIVLAIGLAIGSKLTGLFFLIPPALAIGIQIIRQLVEKKKNLIHAFRFAVLGIVICVGSILIGILSSPYNLIEPENFQSAVFGYEKDVAMGKYEAFYTRQFADTIPFLFQVEKVFPYALGWPVFILGSFGFITSSVCILFQLLRYFLQRIMNYESRMKRKKIQLPILNSYFLILNSSFVIYFLPNAILFAKWTRFMTPILPFFTIFASYFLFLIYRLVMFAWNKNQRSIMKVQNQVNSSKLFSLPLVLIFALCVLILLPGVAFMSVYTHEDSRVTASRWIYENIPTHSYVLSETANVIDIPLGLPNNRLPEGYGIAVISFDFYHLDQNPILYSELLEHLTKADYIFIPSRRIFKNYPRLPIQYPLATTYYDLLFSGKLGFEKVTEISSFPKIGPILFPDEDAEETYSVFDHPVIRIYKKVKSMTMSQYDLLFQAGRL